jgi:PEP-CTERM motif
MISRLRSAAVASAVWVACSAAQAGPFILAGTDADDHGSFSSGVNQEGWFFMQRAIENIGVGVTNGNQTVVVLGSTNSSSGTDAYDAATSAFVHSSLAAAGWSIAYIDGADSITAFLQGGAAGAGIIMLDSGSNVTGGVTTSELTALTNNATFLNTYLAAGGGLFSQANGYDWLSPLLPSVTVNDFQTTGLTLTAAGTAAFPGLADSDLSAGPYHQNFTNIGTLPVLATGIGGNTSLNVIMGAGSGSITDPGPSPIPEPSTYALMLVGLAGVGWATRRRSVHKPTSAKGSPTHDSR